MNVRKSAMSVSSTFALLALCACTSNIAIYEPPTAGRLAKITFVNAAERQKARFATFDDGFACTGRRHIHFDNADNVPTGGSRSVTVAASREFALFASLDTIESEEYGIDMDMVGGGPVPTTTRSVTAIGCTARLSFEVESDKGYHVQISEPVSSGSCSVRVSEIGAEGGLEPVDTTRRVFRSPRDEPGSFCEPLEQ